VCVPLSSITGFWWVVPVLGAAVPIALAVLDKPPRLASGDPGGGNLRERELLRALAEWGDLTPAAAAMRTSLTVDEASEMLEGLAHKGHLSPRAGDGVVSYALPERDRRGMPDAALSPPAEPSGAGEVNAGAPRRLEDPLSEREREVLRLLASGRTNTEVARDLFVSVGTVKSHTGNIYRKLGAKNRAEAVARARELELLP
jgi:ATP/maltotriose-dependent transcriptional regulator MalT